MTRVLLTRVPLQSLGAVVLLALGSAVSSAYAQGATAIADSAAIVGTVERFHEALAGADSLSAMALLTDDVVVLEAGGFETRAEFRQHHLAADIQFARSAKSERRLRSVHRRGEVAWVATTTTATRSVDGREVRSSGAELMVLVRTPTGWRIAAIHWSSRPRRP
jgi:ketosteroid isomerase-like protein